MLAGERAHVIQSFAASSGKLKPNPDLMEIHQRIRPVEKRVLLSQLKLIEMTFEDFAKSLKGFTGLDREDQRVLLKNNAPLFVQVIYRFI